MRVVLSRYFAYSIVLASILCCGAAATGTVSAASGSDWRAGQIIDDGIFYNSNDLSVEQIQQFLNTKNPNCDTWGTQTSEYGGGTRAQYGTSRGYPPPYICLKNYYENPSTHANNLGSSTIPNGSLSAAQIIKNAAVTHGISTRVLIATLQKESQGPLVTDSWPLPNQYRNAMGFGCPDSAPCDAQYYGFMNQVNNTARQFRLYRTNPSSYRHKPFQNNPVLYSPASCGTSSVYISSYGTAALYNYTPYQPNQAALNNLYGHGDSCSSYGNRNFWRLFNDWFGATLTPAAFSINGSVYLKANGIKIRVTQMAILQDYGISPNSIQAIDQATFDAMPGPASGSGLSTTLGSVIKSPSDNDEDGGSIYLVSRGKKYQVKSMQQFFDFGFSEENITYMDLSFIKSISGQSQLSNFVQSPYNSVFKVVGGSKQIIFDYNTYINANPADDATPVSYYIADQIPSSTPLVSSPVLVKLPGSEAVWLYTNSKYYSIPDRSTYDCWGFEQTLHTPIYRAPQSNYLATITPETALKCSVSIDSTTYILRTNQKYTIPSDYGAITSPLTDDIVTSLSSTLPTRSTPLKQYVKSSSDAAVWYIDNGKKKLIPTYSNFKLLGLSDSSIDTLDPATVANVPSDGIKLANGQLVKTDEASAVYAIFNNSRILYASSNLFTSYMNSWNAIESYPTAQLDSYYPQNGEVSPYFYDSDSAKVYLFDSSVCYHLDSSALTAYGQSASEISTGQPYNKTLFPGIKLSSCKPSPYFIKTTGTSLVYWVNGGQKHALMTYSAMLSKNNNREPSVAQMSSSYVNSIPTGTSY